MQTPATQAQSTNQVTMDLDNQTNAPDLQPHALTHASSLTTSLTSTVVTNNLDLKLLWNMTLPPKTLRPHACPEDQNEINYPQLRLLTICGHKVIGPWTGGHAEFYVGWQSLTQDEYDMQKGH